METILIAAGVALWGCVSMPLGVLIGRATHTSIAIEDSRRSHHG